MAWYGEVEFQDSITYAAKEASVAGRRLSLLRRRFNLLRRAEKSLAEYLRLDATNSEIQSAVELVQRENAKEGGYLRAISLREGGRPAHGWKACLVMRMAGFWYIITGTQPPVSDDGDFADLVSAAWNSLHPDIPEIKWDSFVRRFASGSLEEAFEAAFIASVYAHLSDAELQDVKTYLLANEV